MRSLRRVLLLGSLVLTGLWFLREPAPAVASKSHETTGAFSTLPLIAACLAIVLATILWLAIPRDVAAWLYSR